MTTINNLNDSNNKPDFIIIGAMKSATSSLQEQLEKHAGIFMTTPKEPNYFSNDEIYALGNEWYSGLYSGALATSLTGEASTHYTKLPRYPKTVERIAEFAPDAKFVYVMRHPIDRLISHYIHNWSMGFVGRGIEIEQAVADYQNFISYGLYATQLRPWLSQFGKDRILPVFFDRLMQFPQAELERICSFIGYGGEVQWRDTDKPSNVSNQRLRKFPFYDAIVESPPATWVRRVCVPQSIRDKIKARMQLQKRPELSKELLLSLEQTFDEDLSNLGELFGIRLDCKNFKEATSAQSLDWI